MKNESPRIPSIVEMERLLKRAIEPLLIVFEFIKREQLKLKAVKNFEQDEGEECTRLAYPF